ncbi:MAG: GTPase HflX, partial [SAR324 cluster bacterium]|nr:GTPase HflX [SAR324 cluster bacterium]
TYLGKGKLEQAKASMGNCGTDLVLFDNNLTPSQGDNLERALGEMVMDRTQLILEIFGRNVRTHESRIQVELAQLEYMLPRLVGMWAHLDRERGGIGGTKGAGEKQIDIDRSLIRQRIARLKKELRHIAQERHTQNKRRSNCFLVNLVGYTNAGKSTLMNRLTSAGVTVENRLFATLDPTTRVLTRENRPPILLSDTVGFLKRLPHELVASFHSTLEMVRDADLLLHVVDISHPQYEEQIAITEEVLREIGAATNPRMLVFNKTDRLDDKLTLRVARKRNPEAVFISALQDDGGELMAHINAFFEKSMVTTPLLLEYADYGDLSKIYKWGRVDELRYEDDGIHLTVTSTPANLERIRSKLPAAR